MEGIGRARPEQPATPDARRERECRGAETIRSGEMEGRPVSMAGLADAGEHIVGAINSDELVTHACATGSEEPSKGKHDEESVAAFIDLLAGLRGKGVRQVR